jgi:thiol-disulfide isomerase/thioredoxin
MMPIVFGRPAMFFLAAALARCEMINITLANVAEIIGSPRHVFAKFSATSYCHYCMASTLPFSEASTMFPDIIFADVNCPEQEDICEEFDIRGFPLHQLFLPRERGGIEFEGETDMMEYVYFLQNRTRFRARPSPYRKLKHLTERTWPKWTEGIACGLVLFHWEECAECGAILGQLGLMADIFEPDSQISIAAVSCERYKRLCSVLNVPVVEIDENTQPLLRYFVNETWHDWAGPNMTRDLLELINGQCGVDRGLDGMLSDKAGTVPEADVIAEAFGEANNRLEMIEKMEGIPGAEVYRRMMERIAEKGIEQLQKDAEVLKKNLDKRSGSRIALDQMKRRYNVIRHFLPTPTPVPRIKRKGVKRSPVPPQEL